MSDDTTSTRVSSSPTSGSLGSPRTIIVGDVHGCIDELRALLRKCHYRQGVDRLISVGDLIGKGPDSFACVRLIRVGYTLFMHPLSSPF
jgi:hypothetical protein